MNMAKQELTGLSPTGVEELYEEFMEKPASDRYEFEERYCLYGIPHQPDEYDGPLRRCANTAAKDNFGNYRCRFHENRSPGVTDNLTKGNPTHFMHATDEYLMEHLTDEEWELYQNILDWADIYGIDPDEDPAAYDDLKLLAKQRVREVKASKYLFDEGEIREKLVRDEEGNIVLDEEGNPATEDDTNVISEEYRRLVNLISSLKKDLVMTKKEQVKANNEKVQSDAAETASKAMSELVADEEKTFDVDNYDEG